MNRSRNLARCGTPQTRLPREVPGVGPKTSLSFIRTGEDPDTGSGGVVRRSLPLARASAGRLRESGVQGKDHEDGRQDLQAAPCPVSPLYPWPLRPDCDLRRWGEQIIERGEARGKKHEAVAVVGDRSRNVHASSG